MSENNKKDTDKAEKVKKDIKDEFDIVCCGSENFSKKNSIPIFCCLLFK